MTDGTTRAARLAHPLARDALRQITQDRGGCIRPVQLRRTDLDTGQVTQILIPCGATLDTTCPACAKRARSLRAEQCRDGWHLENEPADPAPAPDDQQETWLTLRAHAQVRRDQAAAAGEDTAELDQLIAELDDELARTGIRGSLTRTAAGTADYQQAGRARRARSTRHRQDTPDLPRRPVSSRTTGKVYTAPDGTRYRPSMFLTLTCDSYGRVRDDGTPADPGSYDYQRAARDAIHFAALFDRLIQNLRRYLGYDVQYFAAVEPQRRLAPHVHVAFRGAISRADLRQVIAATYHQVWWPSTDTVRYDTGQAPVWHEGTGRYVDPDTGELLPTWDQALDAIGTLHRLPHEVPHQTRRRMPPRRHRRAGRPRRPARGCAPLRTLLTGLRELAPLRHHPQEPATRPDTRPVQGQSAPRRAPRLRRTPRPDLPQVVRQDPGRPPRRPQSLARGHARTSGNRPCPIPVGARQSL